MAAATLPRLVIESVEPTVDGGRHPVKRVQGDVIEVSADIYKDGHDLVAARVLYRPVGEQQWREQPLEYDFDPDRWSGAFTVDRLGRWEFLIEAWPDHVRTWQEGLKKRLDAGQDVELELQEGAALLSRGLRRWDKPQREIAKAAAKTLSSEKLALEERLEVALSEELLAAAYGPVEAAEATRSEVFQVLVDRERARFAAWYEMFPRSQSTEPGVHGTFADAQRRLPELRELGFDVVYLPPIHPIGRVHRKGKNNTEQPEPSDIGSPWAIGSSEGGHTAVHPDLGTLQDFDRFVAEAERLGLEVALDYALQCAPDHPWATEHPDWFHIRTDGSIRYAENPPKKYQDIYPINFWCKDREALWNACRDIVLFWIGHGVRTFRVDNPHTKPLAFWEWLIADVQRDHPDVIFFAEAFTRPKRMYGLAKLGFTQSYTYFTWKNSSWELKELMGELSRPPVSDFYRGNLFTNTPDILHEYLQRGGRPAFRVRLLLAATLSPLYGIYSGFELCENVPLRPGSEEYLDSEKYQLRFRDYDAAGNLNAEIAELNRLRREHGALQRVDNLTFLDTGSDQILAYWKHSDDEDLVIVVNLDPHGAHDTLVHLPLADLALPADQPFVVEDLLGHERYTWQGFGNYVRLDPTQRGGHVFRLIRPGT